MRGFEMLGALNAMPDAPVVIEKEKKTDEWIAITATLAGGALGSFLGYRFPINGERHEILGLLNGFAVAGNIARVATKEISPRRGAENLGAHALASIAAMALPIPAAGGYLAGAALANLFLRREDSYIERFEETVLGGVFEGVVEDSRPREQEIFDAEIVGGDYTPAPTLAAVRGGLATVKKGQKGDSVVYVQGIAGAIADGEFGTSTETAVKKFQTEHGLSVTGVVDVATITAMDILAGGAGSATKIDFTAPQSQAIAKNLASDLPTEGRPAKGWSQPGGAAPAAEGGTVMLFGRPVSQVLLALIGLLLAGSGVAFALGSTE